MDWFKALYTEDCAQVLEFLTADPTLLWKGLQEDPRRVVEGTTTWKGRTALHVGARRGSLNLVKVVLAIYQDDEHREVEHGCVLAAKDGWYDLDALAMAVVNGNREIIQILANESLLNSKTNPYEVFGASDEGADWESAKALRYMDARLQLTQITRQVMENLECSRISDAKMQQALYKGY